ncbi:diacylglycerol kinase family lipid kinase [Fructobacillus sp. M1-13]|uniref:Diacylglycerol kinase family lipid kinase n=1 Tax=Fructobacillus papyriferae TaxID=2713171 RepID=A0ABS5QPX5_9LACO|nr:diacylglycerol kinase family lipid kinase [Fructobacillus papyriferae]MBS9334877.1 diacylglycerol kinase family lipid kinase [Fructobacillus papyriferae]MCD2158867.1 diacylglycerol kinase family lipid kinase [Fructobacillus papyriferae]
MKRARIIYNPSSGREMVKRDMLNILNVYEQAGYETSTFATTPTPLSAQKEATRAAEAGFDLIVAAGGDGTINEVVNGIAPLKKRPKMAIIPAGTTNDYARALKVSRDDPLEAAKVILKNQTIKMDIGKIQAFLPGENGEAGEKKPVRYFMNIAALGTLSELTYAVPSAMKSLYGYLAYLVKGAELLTRLKPVSAKVSFDDGEYEGDISMIFLALTNSVAGFETIVPDAKLDDGKFTLLIVKKSNLWQIAQLVSQVLKGGAHIKNPNLIYKKTSKVRIDPLNGDPIKVNLDGEYGGDAPMTFDNLKQHIEFVANIEAMGTDDTTDKIKEQFVEQVEKLEAKGGHHDLPEEPAEQADK